MYGFFLYRNCRFLEQFWAPVPLSCSRPFAAKQKNPQLTQRRKHKPKPSLWRARERHVGRRVANEDVQPVVVADVNGICDDAEDGRRSERRTSAAAVRESLCLQELPRFVSTPGTFLLDGRRQVLLRLQSSCNGRPGCRPCLQNGLLAAVRDLPVAANGPASLRFELHNTKGPKRKEK